MAELCYFTGPMDCGKSTLALQLDYTQGAAGRKGRLFTSHDRAGESTISSRLGLAQASDRGQLGFRLLALRGDPADQRPPDRLLGVRRDAVLLGRADRSAGPDRRRAADRRLRHWSPHRFCDPAVSGLRSGSSSCATGSKSFRCAPCAGASERATHNARTVNGEMVLVGDQVVVGDTVPVPAARPG